MGQPDYRIHELNRRLQQRTEVLNKNFCVICIYEIMIWTLELIRSCQGLKVKMHEIDYRFCCFLVYFFLSFFLLPFLFLSPYFSLFSLSSFKYN